MCVCVCLSYVYMHMCVHKISKYSIHGPGNSKNNKYWFTSPPAPSNIPNSLLSFPLTRPVNFVPGPL